MVLHCYYCMKIDSATHYNHMPYKKWHSLLMRGEICYSVSYFKLLIFQSINIVVYPNLDTLSKWLCLAWHSEAKSILESISRKVIFLHTMGPWIMRIFGSKNFLCLNLHCTSSKWNYYFEIMLTKFGKKSSEEIPPQWYNFHLTWY